MATPYLYTITGVRGPVAERVLSEIARAGVQAGEARPVGDSSAALLLASESCGNECLRRVIEAHRRKLPCRAAVFDDAGARMVHQLQLGGRAFDFRFDFEQQFAKLLKWLRETGLLAEGAGATAPAPLPQLFISYQFADRVFATSLHNRLLTIGWDGWYYHGEDRDYDSPSYIMELDGRIRRAVGVVFVLSPEWLRSKDCFSEWLKARRLGKKQVQLKLRDFEDTLGVCDPLYIDVADPGTSWFSRLETALEKWRP